MGASSRQAILDAAARLATVEGLDGLSIGRLADEVGMSKSGLYAHFRSKEELQLETIATASAIYRREVLEQAGDVAGRERIVALADAFLAHVERGVFPGGCFFVAAAAELNVRPGPVRDRIVEFVAGWLGVIEAAVRDAQERGELDASADSTQVAFEVNALLVGANLAFPLFGDPAILDRARKGIRTRLDALSATTTRARARRTPSSDGTRRSAHGSRPR
jgi:AcrR family transcriptional regulator